LKEILQRSGISTDQVQLNPVPFTVTADLLRTGQVDAAVALDPYTTQITKAGTRQNDLLVHDGNHFGPARGLMVAASILGEAAPAG
jgi:ABC-type nitrate/sulfonate/bicarbonate transport system substrate-binding protein